MPKRARPTPPVRVPPCVRMRVRAPRRACEGAAAHIARALRQHARATLRVLRAEFAHVVLVRRLIFQLEVPAGWRRGEVVAPRIAAVGSCDGASTAPGRGAAAPAVMAWRKGIRRSVSTRQHCPKQSTRVPPVRLSTLRPHRRVEAAVSVRRSFRHFISGHSGAQVRYATTAITSRGEHSPGADAAAVRPVPAQMWQRCAQSRCRCGRAPNRMLASPFPASARRVPLRYGWFDAALQGQRCHGGCSA